MHPVITSIGVVLLSAVVEEEGLGGAGGLLAFLGSSVAAAAAAFLLGRFALPRVPLPWIGRAGTLAVMGLLGPTLALAGIDTRETAWEGAGMGLGLAAGFLCYAGLAAGSYRPLGAPRGFTLRQWLAPRLYLVPQIPFAAIAALLAALALVPEAGLLLVRRPLLARALAGLFCAGLLLGAPFLLRLLFPAHPLAGPLADRCAGLAARARVRFRRVLVWETGARGVANACVAGLTSFTRYVFVTDRLLELLTPAEAEAVLAHELSHVRHRHLPLLIAFVAGGFGLFAGGATLLGVEGDVGLVLLLLFAVSFLLGPFAWASRILELEADLGALRLGVAPESMLGALEKLGLLAGTGRRGPSWRHFSIPYRMAAIRASSTYESFHRRFASRRRRALAAIALTVAGGAALVLGSGALF